MSKFTDFFKKKWVKNTLYAISVVALFGIIIGLVTIMA